MPCLLIPDRRAGPSSIIQSEPWLNYCSVHGSWMESKLFDTVHKKCTFILLVKHWGIVIIMLNLRTPVLQRSLKGYLYMLRKLATLSVFLMNSEINRIHGRYIYALLCRYRKKYVVFICGKLTSTTKMFPSIRYIPVLNAATVQHIWHHCIP